MKVLELYTQDLDDRGFSSMVSKILFWGGKNGAFRQPFWWCEMNDTKQITKIKRKKLNERRRRRRRKRKTSFLRLSMKEKILVVYGYIRKYDIRNDLYFVHDIVNICFSFYNMKMDKWDIENSSKYLIFDNNKVSPKLINDINEQQIIDLNDTRNYLYHISKGHNYWKNAFGTTVIEKDQKYRWKLKLTEAKTYYSIRIGIIDIDDVYNTDLLKDNHEQSALDRVSNKAFVMSCFTGYFWHKSIGKPYARQCHDNSIIIMQLDLSNKKGGRLKYIINGTKYGCATTKIDVNKKYILAVSLVNNECITILRDD